MSLGKQVQTERLLDPSVGVFAVNIHWWSQVMNSSFKLKAAIEKAEDRLVTAKARCKDLESSKDYPATRRHWYDFLLSSNAVFSILEQGTKGIPKGKVWVDQQKRLRREDPLLRYLQHARNAEEHDVSSVTELNRKKMMLVENGTPVAAIEDIVGNTGKFRDVSGSTLDLTKINELRIYPDRATLVPVTDRGVVYVPPTKHLGGAIEDPGPITVAKLMVEHIESMIRTVKLFGP